MEFTQETYTKHYIVQALFILMKEYQYEKISVTDVAKKAGVGRATFYRYFKSKDDVILYYFESNTKDFVFNQHIYPRCREDYIKISTEVLTIFQQHKESFKIIRGARLEYLYLDYLNANFLQTFKDDYPDSNPYKPYLYAGMLYNVSIAWLKDDCKGSPQILAEMIVDSIYF